MRGFQVQCSEFRVSEPQEKAAMRLTSPKDADADWEEFEKSAMKGHAG